jgi:4-amino-4-deoxy-L-arabinose transferase-like glycosyltransferase
VRERLTRQLWLAAVVVCFCVPLFVGLGRTDMENDEAIYSYAVDGIVAHGDWLNPLSSPHEHEVFLEKPPLKFWIVAAPIVAGLAPWNEVGMRIWDALFGAVSFIYVFLLGRRIAGSLCGFVSVLVLFVYGPLLFEHGLRNNNMEAPLVLCYCGAIFHYFKWSEASQARERWLHALAVALYFLLGFMTKFVAALFLPLVLVGATIFAREARARLLQDWKLWAVAAAVFLALASPWFLYQQAVAGSRFWQIILGDHVVARMTVSIDPSHIHAWDYYYRTIYDELGRSTTVWLALVGGVLLIGRAVRERTLDVLLVVAWFVLPLAIMSVGTSKLHHYTYPFLPPIAIGAGFGPALLLRKGREPMDRFMTALHERVAGLGVGPRVRTALLVLAAVSFALALVTLVYGPLDITIGGSRIFRNSHAARPLLVAFALATVAGRGVMAARVLLPIALLLAVLPVEAYEGTVRRLMREEHPMRTSRDCLVGVRTRELAAGHPVPGIYTVAEHKWMLHSHYYYLRHLGQWERASTLDEAALERGLFTPGEQRPILIGDGDYQQFKLRHAAALTSLPIVRLRDALLLMPGPYSVCGPVLSALPRP